MSKPVTPQEIRDRIMQLYVVLDTKAKVIVGPIIHDYNPVPIIRQITEAVNKPGTMIANNPEDFGIYHIGEINEATGEIYPLQDPTLLTTALALRALPQ